jgi:hypothetical protein
MTADLDLTVRAPEKDDRAVARRLATSPVL